MPGCLEEFNLLPSIWCKNCCYSQHKSPADGGKIKLASSSLKGSMTYMYYTYIKSTLPFLEMSCLDIAIFPFPLKGMINKNPKS